MRFVVYKDKSGGWRWRLVASNGKTVADSGESYHNKCDLEQTLASICHSIETDNYTIEDEQTFYE